MKSKNTMPNIWIAQENRIHLYRVLALGFSFLTIMLLIILVIAIFRDPIVVLKSSDGQEFYPSHRASASIEKRDVEVISRRFLNALYVWTDFNSQSIGKDINPYVEDTLAEKVVETQSHKYGKDFKDKRLAQEIAFVKITVLDDRVECIFDRILKIEGIPLIIPTEVTLSMLRGNPTRINPMGVFISGIIENEGSK